MSSERRLGPRDRRRGARRWALLLAIGYVVLSAGLLAAVAVVSRSSAERLEREAVAAAWDRYDTAVASCVRGNVIRHRLNVLSAGRGLRHLKTERCAEVVPRPLAPRPSGGVPTTRGAP